MANRRRKASKLAKKGRETTTKTKRKVDAGGKKSNAGRKSQKPNKVELNDTTEDDEVEEEDDDDDDDEDDDEEDDDDDFGEEDDEEEGDGGDFMLSLLEKLDEAPKGKSTNRKSEHDRAVVLQSAAVAESPFGAALRDGSSSSGGGGTAGGGLTLDDLMTGISDSKGFGKVQSELKGMFGVGTGVPTFGKAADDAPPLEPTKAPAPRRITDRASRRVNYEAATEDVGLWQGAVQSQRTAETLDFRPAPRPRASRDDLVSKFVPTTSFEQELAAALEQNRMATDQDVMQREKGEALAPNHDDNDDDDDDLGANAITMEEYKKRRGQLAKMRALLFYEEQKRHHINKIKSKKYRRIRRKQRERVAEAEKAAAVEEDPQLALELQEKEEFERMKERMSLAHKNTSKWAKRVLRRGGKVDVDSRRALSAQLQRGDDLRKKMHGDDGHEDNHHDDDENATTDTDLLAQAQAILQETENDSQAAAHRSKLGPKGALFQMGFMQRGLDQQRERAKEEARQLLMELQANTHDDDSDDDDDDDANDKEAKSRRDKSAKNTNDTPRDMDDIPFADRVANEAMKRKRKNSVDEKSDRPNKQSQGGAAKDAQESSSSSPKAKKAKKTRGKLSKESTGTELVPAAKQQKEKDSSRGQDQSFNEFTTSFSVSTVDPLAHNADWNVSSARDTTIVTPKDEASSSEPGGLSEKSTLVNRRALVSQEEENPWIQTSGASDKNVPDTTTPSDDSDANEIGDGSQAAGPGTIKASSSDTKEEEEEDAGEEPSDNADANERSLTALSQEELVRRAFATPSELEIDEEFAKEKEEMRDSNDPSSKEDDSKEVEMRGWGSWCGQGVAAPPPPPPPGKRKQPPSDSKQTKNSKTPRRDDGNKRVIINERPNKKLAQFQITQIPHPYASREQYERSMSGAVGREWHVTDAVKRLTMPPVLVRTGKIIQPISVKAKAKTKRAPAKF